MDYELCLTAGLVYFSLISGNFQIFCVGDLLTIWLFKQLPSNSFVSEASYYPLSKPERIFPPPEDPMKPVSQNRVLSR